MLILVLLFSSSRFSSVILLYFLFRRKSIYLGSLTKPDKIDISAYFSYLLEKLVSWMDNRNVEIGKRRKIEQTFLCISDGNKKYDKLGSFTVDNETWCVLEWINRVIRENDNTFCIISIRMDFSQENWKMRKLWITLHWEAWVRNFLSFVS